MVPNSPNGETTATTSNYSQSHFKAFPDNSMNSKIVPVEDPSFPSSEEDKPVVWFYKDGKCLLTKLCNVPKMLFFKTL